MSRPEGTRNEGGNADLAVVAVAVVVLDVLVAVPVVPGAVRGGTAIPVLLFATGYAVVSALFPDGDSADGRRRLGLLGRLVLAVGASVGVVVAVGVALEFTVFGFRTVPVLVGINVVTLLALAAAWRRRRATDERFGIGVSAAFDRSRSFLVGDGRVDALLTVAAVLCVLAAVGVVYAAPPSDADGTEAYLLTEADGELVADDYPGELTVGEPTTLHLAVSAPDSATSAATVVVALHDIETSGDGASVASSTELDRFALSLDDETTITEHEVVPTVAGEWRLTYLVYFGAVPETPRPATADRQVHLQVDIVAD